MKKKQITEILYKLELHSSVSVVLPTAPTISSISSTVFGLGLVRTELAINTNEGSNYETHESNAGWSIFSIINFNRY